MADLLRTPLHALHVSHGAKMGPFAGYDMPLHYPEGVLREHLHARAGAGLFDVSHMGQILLRPRSGRLEDAALALEALVPVDVLGLKPGRQRYGFFTTPDGGILDDLMIAHRGDHLHLVVNAANKAADLAHLQARLGETCEAAPLDNALLALQGPEAGEILAGVTPDAAHMRFMDVRELRLAGECAVASRSGYTGEDGFEISLPAGPANDLARLLLERTEVRPAGLGARDSLRLEAGLCLHGQDIDPPTTPVEAALEWAIQGARRRGGAREGGFPGAERILGQIEAGAPRRRVMLLPEGRAPMRRGVTLHAAPDGAAIGRITSGGFGPSLDAPVSMGYVEAAHAAPGTRLLGLLRGKMQPVIVARTPLIQPGYKRA